MFFGTFVGDYKLDKCFINTKDSNLKVMYLNVKLNIYYNEFFKRVLCIS